MVSLFGNTRIVSATASGALTLGRAVTLSLSAGVLLATAAAVGGRIDGFISEPAEDGKQVGIQLVPGTDILIAEAGGTTVAGDPVYNYATGVLGPASQTAAGQIAGIALEAVSSGQRFRYIAFAATPGLKIFAKTAVAGDGTNGYIDFVHGWGANPAGNLVFAQNGSTGAPRTIATVTYPDTNTIRCTVTSLATNDIVTCLAIRKVV
jgi:hypothetical protein